MEERAISRAFAKARAPVGQTSLTAGMPVVEPPGEDEDPSAFPPGSRGFKKEAGIDEFPRKKCVSTRSLLVMIPHVLPDTVGGHGELGATPVLDASTMYR